MDDNIIDIKLEGEEIDFLAEMEKAKEYTPVSDAIPLELPAPGATDSDFDPDPETTPGEGEDEKKEGFDINAEDLTNIIIDGSDMVMENLLPWLYRSTIDKSDLHVMTEISREYKKAKSNREKIITFSERQQEVMDVYVDYESYVENLPLTAKEKKNLRQPLKKLLQSVNFTASPSNTLLAVAAMILVPRLFPILAKYLSKTKPE